MNLSNDFYKMSELLTKDQKHLLWKDEINDTFVLLKYCEIYRYSEKHLRLLIWSPSKYSQVKKMMPAFYDWATDDGLCILEVENATLSRLIALGAHKQRPHIKGRWIGKIEEKLGHRIFPYRTELMEV